jgi:hypothetical protein
VPAQESKRCRDNAMLVVAMQLGGLARAAAPARRWQRAAWGGRQVADWLHAPIPHPSQCALALHSSTPWGLARPPSPHQPLTRRRCLAKHPFPHRHRPRSLARLDAQAGLLVQRVGGHLVGLLGRRHQHGGSHCRR